MVDICDVHDETGQRTGRVVERGTALEPGEYYLVVQVWIRNHAGEYLIQQRAPHLVSGPGMWATTAGQVLANEMSLDGAIREVQEELGITLTPDVFSRFDRLKRNSLMQDVWFALVPTDVVPVLGSEVSAWKWASKSVLRRMIEDCTFFGYSYFDRLPE